MVKEQETARTAEFLPIEIPRKPNGSIIRRNATQSLLLGNVLTGNCLRVVLVSWANDQVNLLINRIANGEEKEAENHSVKTETNYKIGNTGIFLRTFAEHVQNKGKLIAFKIEMPESQEIILEELIRLKKADKKTTKQNRYKLERVPKKSKGLRS